MKNYRQLATVGFFVLLGCGGDYVTAPLDVRNTPPAQQDMARAITVCDQDSWAWVRSPADLGNDQRRVLLEGTYTVMPYKNGRPSETDQWQGVVHKLPEGNRCWPVLQSFVSYTRGEHTTIDCHDVATLINVTFPREDTVSILLNCVPAGRATAYQVTRTSARPMF